MRIIMLEIGTCNAKAANPVRGTGSFASHSKGPAVLSNLRHDGWDVYEAA